MKKLTADGAAFYSVDHDAEWGHRTETDRRPTEHFLGYEGHIATYAPGVGGTPIPQLAAGLALRPGIRDRAAAAVSVIDSVGTVHAVLLDRGYTTAKAENLARPLRQRQIQVAMDLHKTQRGVRPGPVTGTIWLDGSCTPRPSRTDYAT